MIFLRRDQRARPRVAACRNQGARELPLANGGQQRLDCALFGGFWRHHQGSGHGLGWSL